MSTAHLRHPSALSPPSNLELPLFVYGALKPDLPAFEQLRPFVKKHPELDLVCGSLYVRDGLPLLFPNDREALLGFLLQWKPGQARSGYEVVCQFEPRKHYQWSEVVLKSGTKANTLTARYPDKGNPQPLYQYAWCITSDPAFGPGLSAVRDVCAQLPLTDRSEDNWPGFFRAQMAYLLLWSILERLSALCFGPDHEPTKRAIKLHELPGIPDLLAKYVTRTDKVSDSRDPSKSYKLNVANPKKCFEYYYQVRSNLSHRGKGVWKEYDKVKKSLEELLSVTEDYLKQLRAEEIDE